jgi:hypothetical protein
MVMYLPREKILIEADIYTPPAMGAPMDPPAAAVNLYDNIKAYNIDVQTIAGLHGRVGPWAGSCVRARSRTEHRHMSPKGEAFPTLPSSFLFRQIGWEHQVGENSLIGHPLRFAPSPERST